MGGAGGSGRRGQGVRHLLHAEGLDLRSSRSEGAGEQRDAHGARACARWGLSKHALTKECASAQSGLASHADLHCTSMGRVSSAASRLRNTEPLARIMPDPTGMPWQTALAPLTPFR